MNLKAHEVWVKITIRTRDPNLNVSNSAAVLIMIGAEAPKPPILETVQKVRDPGKVLCDARYGKSKDVGKGENRILTRIWERECVIGRVDS